MSFTNEKSTLDFFSEKEEIENLIVEWLTTV